MSRKPLLRKIRLLGNKNECLWERYMLSKWSKNQKECFLLCLILKTTPNNRAIRKKSWMNSFLTKTIKWSLLKRLKRSRQYRYFSPKRSERFLNNQMILDTRHPLPLFLNAKIRIQALFIKDKLKTLKSLCRRGEFQRCFHQEWTILCKTLKVSLTSETPLQILSWKTIFWIEWRMNKNLVLHLSIISQLQSKVLTLRRVWTRIDDQQSQNPLFWVQINPDNPALVAL